jgi:hypothetical protein
MPGPDFAYVQSRLSARYGNRPDEAHWRTLEASRAAEHYLAQTRSGPLAPWTEGLLDARDPHRIEQHLRTRWQHHVDEVARWSPRDWQRAVRAFARLPELALPHRNAPTGAEVAARWLSAWLRTLPDSGVVASLCRRSAELLLPRLADPQRAGGPRRTARALAEQSALARLFRRHAATAVAVFAYLALVALDLERLRGGLVVRSMFDAERA